jgi:hypothetical protein
LLAAAAERAIAIRQRRPPHPCDPDELEARLSRAETSALEAELAARLAARA